MDALNVGAGLGLGAICVAGAYFDLRYRRLPNWLCAVAFVSGLVFVAATAGWVATAMALVHAALALLVGAGLFALGGIGAGDAKYYAGLAAWFALRDGALLLTAVSLVGLILIVGWLAWRMSTRRRGATPPSHPFDKLPYGIAVSVGAVAAFVLTR
jgi:prepilin peptidase CpaA